MLRVIVPVTLILMCRASPDCGSLSSCDKCTATSSWWPGSSCNWCPLTLSCHAHVSLENPCSSGQNVDKPSQCTASDVPEQIHIALAGATGMNIMWATLGPIQGSVQFGIKPDTLDQSVTAETPRQYLENYGYHHSATLTGLKPNTKYYYKVGGQTGWSATSTFSTAPADPTTPFTMSVFGDLGYEGSDLRPLHIPAVDGLQSNWSAGVTRARLEMIKDHIDLVWHLGDIGYADDAFDNQPASFAYEDTYNGWMNWMQNISGTKPYMVAVGNHEAECHSPACVASSKGKALSNYTAFNTRWRMPYASSGSRSNMWYSFNYASAHVVSLNSETDFEGSHGGGNVYSGGGFGAAGEQRAWLEADLAAAHARRVNGSSGIKWILVGGHRPLSELAQFHKDLFHKYGVDMYFAGHSHSYTRSSDVNGTTLIVVGGAGCDEMTQQPKSGMLAPNPSSLDDTQQGAWWKPGYNVPLGTAEFTSGRYATGLLHVNQSTLEWQLIDSEDGEILDATSLQAKY